MAAADANHAQPPSGSSAATAYPPWVLLEHSLKEAAVGSFSNAAPRAASATALTSTGQLIVVSFDLAAPPAVSSVRVHPPSGVDTRQCWECGNVVTAHGDSVLIYINFLPEGDGHDRRVVDYFVYSAGAADTPRPPTLSLIPRCYLTEDELKKIYRWNRGRPVQRLYLDKQGTGLLRRGEDEFVVAELKIIAVATVDMPEKKKKVAELLLFRHGRWSLQRPRTTIHGEGKRTVAELMSSWKTKTVVPVGDTHLCWVDLYQGLLFCSVFHESPVLRHVPLPAEAHELEPLFGPASSRNVCVTGGGSTVKFVGVFPRCCCGGAGSTHCRRSHYAYTVKTWTLMMETMAWVMDGMVDATELWALDAYNGLLRVPLSCPIVSMEDPNTICFSLCEWYHDKDGGDRTQWLLLVDMRKKTLLSVYCRSDEQDRIVYRELHPSMVSRYLDPNPGSREDVSSSRESHMDMNPSLPVDAVDEPQENEAINSAPSSWKSSPEPGMQASAVFTGFQEIPSYGLDRDDMLKAYNILSLENGRRLRSLLGLPKNMRKDWLLMEIKSIVA